MFCPSCGKAVPDGVQFCSSCGAAVPPQASQPSEQPATVTPSASRFSHLPEYWQNVFRKFDEKPTKMQTHWNWPAFFFGPFWYLVKGMPVKGAFYVLIVVGTVGFGLFLAVYAGLYGAWDYYLKEAQGKQLW
jgi:predicted nucleic acid-binding Zn ribbon protein